MRSKAPPPPTPQRMSHLQLLLPKGFHSRHPARRRTSTFCPVTFECRDKRIEAAAPCSQAEDGVISPLYPPLCDLPPPPFLSAALWRNSRGVQKCPSPVRCTQPAGQRADHHYGAMMPDVNSLHARTHSPSYCRRHLRFQWASVSELVDHFHANCMEKIFQYLQNLVNDDSTI